MAEIKWQSLHPNQSKRFTCAHCSSITGSNEGWKRIVPRGSVGVFSAFVYICQNCFAPTYFDDENRQIPAPSFGNAISNISGDIGSLYEEARNAFSVNAYTASAMSCRKLLMSVAVSEGSPDGEDFVFYVQYLLDHQLISKKAKDWIDHIRKQGNIANHTIKIFEREEAANLLTFIEMLLKSNYEYLSMLPAEKTSQ